MWQRSFVVLVHYELVPSIYKLVPTIGRGDSTVDQIMTFSPVETRQIGINII